MIALNKNYPADLDNPIFNWEGIMDSRNPFQSIVRQLDYLKYKIEVYPTESTARKTKRVELTYNR